MSRIERIDAGDRDAWLRLRGRDITGSVAGALFGVHPHTTPFQIFAEKTGRIQPDNNEQKQMIRGRKAEGVAVDILKEEHPDWTIVHNEGADRIYLRDPAARIGATPDIFVNDPERGPGGIQVKNIEQGIYRRTWITADRAIEPPLWICVQALLEAHLAGWEWVDVAPIVWGFGLDLTLIPVPKKPTIIDALYSKTEEFWRIVDSGEEMAPDFGRDGEAISRMFSTDDGSEADLPLRAVGLAARHAEQKKIIKAAEAEIDKTNAEMKALMGNHSTGRLSDGRLVKWRVEPRRAYSVAASEPRVLRYPKE